VIRAGGRLLKDVTVGGVIAAGVLPATLEFLDARCIQAVEAYAHLDLDAAAGAMLLFGDDGSTAEVDRTVRAMADMMREHRAVSVQVATAAAESDAVGTAKLPFLDKQLGPAQTALLLARIKASSPQGRIALMRAIDHGTVGVFDPAAREQGAFCLGCRACEPVCPAGVPYGGLLEDLRDAQWQGRRRHLRVRPLLTFATSRLLVRLVGMVRKHVRFTPANRIDDGADMLMLGCFERTLFPEVSRAATGTLPGLQVPRDQGCCGALHAHNGDAASGAQLARELVARSGRSGRIVSTAGGCAAHLSAVAGRDRVVDYSEALLERGPLPGPILIDGRPARIGRRIMAAKLAALAEPDLDFLAVVNPGCQRQLIAGLRRARLRTRVLHLAELAAMAQAESAGR
jgi:glycolate oxidase iron-sulfur subunit